MDGEAAGAPSKARTRPQTAAVTIRRYAPEVLSTSFGHLVAVGDRLDRRTGAPRCRTARRSTATVIDRRETLRMVPETCVFGLFEALWSRNHLSHADFAPRSAANAFAGTPHMFDTFVDVQPVASDHNRAAERALGNSISAPGGHSRRTIVNTYTFETNGLRGTIGSTHNPQTFHGDPHARHTTRQSRPGQRLLSRRSSVPRHIMRR